MCVNILKTKTLFVPGRVGWGDGNFLNSLFCGFLRAASGLVLLFLRLNTTCVHGSHEMGGPIEGIL